MNASIILAHPYKQSFNHAIYHRAIKTFTAYDIKVFTHDLYREKFNPVLSEQELGKKPSRDKLVKRYTSELQISDFLVFVHPNWWGQPPAILKGYIDRVIRQPHAYDFATNNEGGLPIGKLPHITGVVFNTSNTEESRENDYFGDPLQDIWQRCVFGFCGMEDTYRTMFRIVADSSESERIEWLDDVERTVAMIVTAKTTDKTTEGQACRAK